MPFYSLCNSLSPPTISQLLVSEATLDFTSACQYLTIVGNTHVLTKFQNTHATLPSVYVLI